MTSPNTPKPPVTSPGTLAAALEAEKQGLGHVEWRDGRPVWVSGPVRFQGGPR